MYDFKEPRVLSKKIIASIKFGKDLHGCVFFHISMIQRLPLRIREVAEASLAQAPGANIIKLDKNGKRISLLVYPNFEKEAHPSPTRMTVMNLDKGTKTTLEFSNYIDPPVLHEKETLVGKEFKLYKKFANLTSEEKKAGLLDYPEGIVLKSKWEALLDEKQAIIKDHTLSYPGTKDERTSESSLK